MALPSYPIARRPKWYFGSALRPSAEAASTGQTERGRRRQVRCRAAVPVAHHEVGLAAIAGTGGPTDPQPDFRPAADGPRMVRARDGGQNSKARGQRSEIRSQVTKDSERGEKVRSTTALYPALCSLPSALWVSSPQSLASDLCSLYSALRSHATQDTRSCAPRWSSMGPMGMHSKLGSISGRKYSQSAALMGCGRSSSSPSGSASKAR